MEAQEGEKKGKRSKRERVEAREEEKKGAGPAERR